MDKIIIKVNGSLLKEVPLSNAAHAEYCMGRDLNNEIVVEDQKASRRHVLLTKEKGRYFLKDLGSTNGSYLNEEEMLTPNEDREIFHGDVLSIGDHRLEFDLPSLCDTAVGGPDSQMSDWANDAAMKAHQDESSPGSTIPVIGGHSTRRRSSVNQGSAGSQEDLSEKIQALNAHLLVVQGQTREIYELTQSEITLGRDPSNDICVPHHSISSRHAKFTFSNGRFTVEDLRSTNGTMVNGTLIHKQAITSPALIVFGDVVCLYTTEESLQSQESQEKLIKQISRNLTSQGLISKKQVKAAVKESGSSLRELGETLILNGMINPDHWMEVLRGDKAGRVKSGGGFWVKVILLFAILVLGAGGGIIYLFKNLDKEVRKNFSEAKAAWKTAKKESDLEKFEEVEKKLRDAKLNAASSELRETIQNNLAKLLVDYGSALLEKGKEKEGLKKLKETFTVVTQESTPYRDAVLSICKYFEKKALGATEERERKNYLLKIVEPEKHGLEFQAQMVKDEPVYKKAVSELCTIYFFNALEHFKKGKIKDADDMWEWIVNLKEDKDKKNLYYLLSKAGSISCEIIRRHAREDLGARDAAYRDFKSVMDEVKERYPNYIQKIQRHSKVGSLVFQDKVEEIMSK